MSHCHSARCSREREGERDGERDGGWWYVIHATWIGCLTLERQMQIDHIGWVACSRGNICRDLHCLGHFFSYCCCNWDYICYIVWPAYDDVRIAADLYLLQRTLNIRGNSLNTHICLKPAILMKTTCFLFFRIEMNRKLCEIWWLQSELVGLQYPYSFTYPLSEMTLLYRHMNCGFLFSFVCFCFSVLNSYFLFASNPFAFLIRIFTPWNFMDLKTNHYLC